MTVQIRLKGIKRFGAKTKSISAYVRQDYAPEVVTHGHRYASAIAPKNKGALLRAIKKKKKQKSGKLILLQPNDGRNRPYHLWMHGIRAPAKAGSGAGSGYDISRGKYRPKSGKRGPMFMFETADEMKRYAIERFKKKIKTL